MSEPRKIAMAEVKKHSTEEDCWVVYKGKVYDVSPFVEEHPGGGLILVEDGGGETTFSSSV